jgi:hypothetical protein
MNRRFSARELSFLRNKVPINRVIETMLSVATGNNNTKPSFHCPVCQSVNTSINARHNLARCFDCQQNFNPIEFVMHQLNLNFVDSVKWLKQHSRHIAPEKPPTPKNPFSQPIHIGDVLSGTLASLPAKTSTDPVIKILTKRVAKIEHSVAKLDLLVQELRTIVYRR